MTRSFAAPWSTSLKVISLLATILLPALFWLLPAPEGTPWVPLRVFV